MIPYGPNRMRVSRGEMVRHTCQPDESYPSYEAIGHYHHCLEDICLFAEMGFRFYRMSIAWTRIIPNGNDDVPNEAGIRFYRALFEECRKYGTGCRLHAVTLPKFHGDGDKIKSDTIELRTGLRSGLPP